MSRHRGGGESTRRRLIAPLAAGLAIGLVSASIGGGAAFALPTDRAEAEGLLLSGGGLVDLDTVAALAGAYTSFPPADELDAPIDVTALGAIDLGLGVQLFGGNDVLTLGGVGQYSNSDATGAYAASGLITADGGIQVGTGAPGENTTLTLAPVLDALGLDALVSDLSLELGAVAATATAARGASVTPVGDYQIASGEISLTAPVLGTTLAALDADLTAASTAINGLAAPTGPINTTVGGLLGGIDAILEGLLLGLVDLDDPTVTTALAVDLGAALDTVSDDEFVSGPITLTLSTGEITIDLDELYALNAMPANSELLADAGLNPTIAAALSDILTVQLPDALGDALTTVLNTTSLDVTVDAGVSSILGDLGVLALTIDGTVGGLLGLDGSTAPTVSLAGTSILGLPVGTLLTPITDYVVGTILPAVGGVIEGVFDLEGLEGTLTTTLTGLVTALGPVLDAVNDVVSITVNVQETPGDFRDALGTDAGSFTQRAVSLVVAPGLGGAIELNLASATVRAVPLAAPADLAIDPVRGPVTGGTTVTITGDNLSDTTEVAFGGEPAEFTIEDDGSLTVITPAAAAPGTVPVAVTNIDGTDDSLEFEYFAVTEVDGIDPDSGSTLGGDEVTISGVCFTGATGVTFGGVAATDFTVVSDTEITVTTPAGAEGAVDVTITNPTDCGPITVEDGFVYVAPGAPVIADIDPAEGPETGGTTVTITGDEFTGTTSVTFDGVEATEFTVISDTEIEAVTPAGTPGVVDVVVTSDIGASAPFDFEYLDVVDVDEVDPAEGPEAGGTEVTITGDCFTGATDVLFGGVSATTFTVVSDTEITAVVPAGTGTVDVSVVGAGTCGTGTLEDAYEFIPAPIVTDLDPTEGPETGGTVVTITGTGFTGATGVLFGTEPGTAFTVVSDTEIEVTTPAGDPGVVTVTVQHPGGDVDAGDFEYLELPAITGLDPVQGPDEGGTVVTVTGTGFTGATGVTFDGDAGTDLTVVSDTEIEVTTPAHAPGPVDVVVEHPNGDSEPGTFTYVVGATVDEVDPAEGPEDGGNEVTITGSCFTGATDVTFGAVSATSFTVVSDTEITAVVPAGTGAVDVAVVGAAECGTGTLEDAYEFIPAPVVTDLDPTEGPETGGTVVTITGTGFTGATGVLFGTEPGTAFTVVSDTEIEVTTPAGEPGVVTVTVQHPGGNVDAGDFAYLDVPDITGLDPVEGPEDGGTVVTITGTGFTGATGVTFDGVAGTAFTVVSDTEIEVTTPAHAPGAVDVVVEHPNGDSLPGDFTYLEGTEIDDVTPPGGPEEGGTEVTITGECFTGATAVLFGTTPATSFTVVSDTEITAIAPPGAGIVDITVVGAAECGTETEPEAYEYTDAPVIGGISPDSGPEAGGTVVTITGVNFEAVTSVTFDGIEGTELTVVSDTELTVATPAHAPGDVDVVATSILGSSDPVSFLYYGLAPAPSGDGGDGGLANTGSDGGSGALLTLGVLLVGAGVAVLRWLRIRRRAAWRDA